MTFSRHPGPQPVHDRLAIVSGVHASFWSELSLRPRSLFTTDAALLGVLFGGVFEIRYRLPTSATATTYGHFDPGSSFLAGTTAETVFLFSPAKLPLLRER